MADSFFGAELAAGDFDGDGRDELAVGASTADVFVSPSLVDEAGKVFTFGYDGGVWASTGSWSQASSGVPGDAEAGDWFGATLAVGDFDDDGYDDLAIGSFFEAVGAISAAGAVNVLYGGGSGLSSAFAQIWYRSGGGIDGTAGGDLLGHALAAGDFDGDHIDDLAIGSPSRTIDGVDGTGDVVVLFGVSVTGLTGAGQQQIDPTDLGEDAADQSFGTALAAGELYPNNICAFFSSCADDLAIGASGTDVFGFAGLAVEAGRTHVLFGSQTAGGLDLASHDGIDQSSIDAELFSSPDFVDQFGRTLAIGDLDRRSGADLVIGVPNESFDGVGSAGCAHLLFGGSTDLDADPGQFVWGRAPLAAAPQQSGDGFALALAIGDFDGNGTGDLAIGLPGRTRSGQLKAGAVQILYGALFADGFESGTAANWSNL